MTLLIGPTVAVPAPQALLEALQRVEVTHPDNGRAGFQLSFTAGRSGAADLVDYPLLYNPLLRPFNRVILQVAFGVVPRVLMDGVITQYQLQPGSGREPGTLTVTGEDVSVMMDRENKAAEHPAQPEPAIVSKIIASYAQYLIAPIVVQPPSIDLPMPTERTPTQQETDYAYLDTMARRFGYIFYVDPGPVPGSNVGYWGPPIRTGTPQHALSVNMGPETNVDQISFSYDATSSTVVKGKIIDRQSGESVQIQTFMSSRPPLSAMPDLLINQATARVEGFRESGLTALQAFARAQGRTDASTDRVVTASGTLDALRYGDLLKPRALVDVRGAGYTCDGTWYVSNVTHSIEPGKQYKQSFSLSREGFGAQRPGVVP